MQPLICDGLLLFFVLFESKLHLVFWGFFLCLLLYYSTDQFYKREAVSHCDPIPHKHKYILWILSIYLLLSFSFLICLKVHLIKCSFRGSFTTTDINLLRESLTLFIACSFAFWHKNCKEYCLQLHPNNRQINSASKTYLLDWKMCADIYLVIRTGLNINVSKCKHFAHNGWFCSMDMWPLTV